MALLKSRLLFAAGTPKATPISSSVWSSIKSSFLQMKASIKWLIGSSSSLHFWTDEWIQPTLANRLNIPLAQQAKMDVPISKFLINGVWHLSVDLPSSFTDEILQIHPLKSTSDVCL